MEFEFDKEMDALLRQAAQGETALENSKFKIQDSKSPHLDADEISLFAENVLPEKSRQGAVAHFADCGRCRKILSDLISQNPENEIVFAGQTKVFAPTIPWYRKLFAFPNIAYTMGALALVFSGLVAFILLQSVENSKNSEVSQISERQLNGKGMSSDGDSMIVEKQNSTAMMSNSMSNASSMSNSAAASSSNAMMSNAPTKSAARSSNANLLSNTSTAANKSSVSTNESPKDEPRSEDKITQKAVTDLPLNGRTARNLPEQERDKKEAKTDAETSDAAKSLAPQPKPEQLAVAGNQIMSDAPSAKTRKNSRENIETTNAGGKTFQRQNNVWIDSAYKNQATTNITRGTREFKKLDSGLRSIAGNLGGIVIIVWKDKAYRIQ